MNRSDDYLQYVLPDDPLPVVVSLAQSFTFGPSNIYCDPYPLSNAWRQAQVFPRGERLHTQIIVDWSELDNDVVKEAYIDLLYVYRQQTFPLHAKYAYWGFINAITLQPDLHLTPYTELYQFFVQTGKQLSMVDKTGEN